MTLKELQQQSRWLSRHAANVTSQFGEDGMIAAALAKLPSRDSWCVEFGAWDGKQFSNTWDLVHSQNYRGVFIEADPARFEDLKAAHGPSGRHVLVNAFVGWSDSDGLDAILSQCDISPDFDFLSIDIDGNDFHVWKAVRRYRPKLVMIEFNPTIANSIDYVQTADGNVNRGAAPASLVALGKEKGYELIAATEANLLFVEASYYPAFDIPDNSLGLMRDESEIPRLFIGMDGHIFLSQSGKRGSVTLPWHGLTLDESRVQAMPRRLQKYLCRYTPWERFLFRLKFGFRRPRAIVQKILGGTNHGD